MSDSIDPQGAGIEVSPEEKRFLRGFVRRQLVPWTLMLLAVGALGVGWRGGGDASDLEARTAAALAQVRNENQKLRAELVSLRSEMAGASASHSGGDELERRVEDAKANVRMIESRISAALERRINALEAGLARGATASASAEAGPPPEAAAWDVSAILDRLYALEMREGQSGSAASDTRVAAVERRLIQLEAATQGVPLPAAPAPTY
ncbi:MAG: hypothetical protein JRH16_03860 [Deltaproteobacteria bacterium]|nr:hypothetical protein [Deltaproteobacteria bacterium]MBW2363431.1 hypothetical protein [Deltaproteobacteria bacterium]